jgi:hypothetical protein
MRRLPPQGGRLLSGDFYRLLREKTEWARYPVQDISLAGQKGEHWRRGDSSLKEGEDRIQSSGHGGERETSKEGSENSN